MKRREILTVVIFAIIKGAASQKVKVDKEVVSKPGETFQLHCKFVETPGILLTQVSWVKESGKGQRENIAVFHPQHGANYPETSVKGRVSFSSPSLSNPSISVSNAMMTDAGSYTCEYATYPSGNEQATTKVIILAKPKNSGSILTVPEGTVPVVVAHCVSAGGQPDALIFWDTAVGGNWTNISKLDVNNTVTVTSEYWLVPTANDNGKDITCFVSHRTQDSPESIKMKLNIEYTPKVSIQGYDGVWYLGRTNVELVCLADGNPKPTSVEWTAMSGQMPNSVQMNPNKLTVQKVDETINTTFVCEAKNRLGSGKNQVTTFVLERAPPLTSSITGSIIGAIIGVVILVALIVTAVLLFCRKRRCAENADGPPNYKPPPPIRTAGSSEMLNETSGVEAESQPLDLYYETSHEPVTDLDANDDDDNVPNGDSAVPQDSHESAQLCENEVHPHASLQENSGVQEAQSTISHGDSFISSAMLV